VLENLSSPKGLRRDPQQARSRARVQAILDAANQILATEGVDALTMRRVAEMAEVPIGTIYQFFEDKSAVLGAVAYRYLDAFTETMATLATETAGLHGDDLLDRVFDTFTALYRTNPGYVAIWSGRHLSRELMEADDANNDTLAEGLRQILLTEGRVRDEPGLAISCRVLVQMVDALLQLAFRLDPHGEPMILSEAKRVGRLYVEEISS
jgi:AcrR family transcriptional regulator